MYLKEADSAPKVPVIDTKDTFVEIERCASKSGAILYAKMENSSTKRDLGNLADCWPCQLAHQHTKVPNEGKP